MKRKPNTSIKMKTGKLMLWNNNRMSGLLVKKKKMTWNNDCYNNQLSWSSSPILKRHKKMIMDDDLIGKEKSTTTISDLPEEILTKVLVRVSVKDVLSCLCVKKSWFFLIKTLRFITLHSNHHHEISNNEYLLFRDVSTNDYEIRLDDIQCEKYITLKYPPHLSKQCFEFRLESDGLICLFDLNVTRIPTPQRIHLWNPVIKKCVTLPHSPHPLTSPCWKAVAFGFVPQINDHLVVVMAKYGLKNTHYIMTCVYNLSTNSWKQITHHNIQNLLSSQKSQKSIIVNGIAIWTGFNSHSGDRFLVCFDTKTEMLQEILPPESLTSDPLICAFDQSVVLFVEKGTFTNEHHMWVMKGDPMNEFVWEKKMMIKEKSFVRVLGLRNNGEPILRKSHDLISYNLDTHKSYDFVKSWNSWKTFHFGNDRRGAFHLWKELIGKRPFIIKPFAESLILLDICPTN